MEQVKYFKILKNNYKIILATVLAFAVIGAVMNILQAPKYKAETELLVLQKQTDQMDAYTATKAAEKIGINLTKVIYTTSFMNKVLDTSLVNESIFAEAGELNKRADWKDMLGASVVSGTGIIKITTYASTQAEAVALAEAVNYILVNDNSEYHGGGENILVRTINSPIASDKPIKSSMLLTLVIAVVAGLVITSSFVLFLEEIKKLKYSSRGGADNNDASSGKDQSKPKSLFYQILDHKTFPRFHYALADAAEPVTMHDHLK